MKILTDSVLASVSLTHLCVLCKDTVLLINQKNLKLNVFQFSLNDHIRAAEGRCCKTWLLIFKVPKQTKTRQQVTCCLCAGDSDSLEKASD